MISNSIIHKEKPTKKIPLFSFPTLFIMLWFLIPSSTTSTWNKPQRVLWMRFGVFVHTLKTNICTETNRHTPAENLWFPSVMFLWKGTTSWESLVNTRRDTHCADNPQVNICNGSTESPASDSSMNHTCCPPPTAAPAHSSGNISPPFTTRGSTKTAAALARTALWNHLQVHFATRTKAYTTTRAD